VAEGEREDDRKVRVVAVADPGWPTAQRNPCVLLNPRCSSAVKKPAFRKNSKNVLYGGLLGGCSELRLVRPGEPPRQPRLPPREPKAGLLDMIVAEATPHGVPLALYGWA
jgi:hypothetical protein